MQLVLTLLRFLLLLTLMVVGFALIHQLDTLNRTLKHNRLHFEQVLKEHQQFLDEHARRMERYEGSNTGSAR
jgi:hypothetical protein